MSAVRRALLLALALAATNALGANCSVSTLSVAFGGYSPLAGTARDGVGSVEVRCSDAAASNVAHSIALGAGTGSYALRLLASGADRLEYNLFTDSARSLVWGDGTAGTATVNDSYILLSPTTRSYTVYGRIPGGQRHTAVGTYSDHITVTVTF